MLHAAHVKQCSLWYKGKDEKPKLTTEASTIGLRPGYWPDFITLMKDTNLEGEGVMFHKVAPFHVNNELAGYTYCTRDTEWMLVVWND